MPSIKQIFIGLTGQQLKVLDRIARQKRISRSAIMRAALAAWLEATQEGVAYEPNGES